LDYISDSADSSNLFFIPHKIFESVFYPVALHKTMVYTVGMKTNIQLTKSKSDKSQASSSVQAVDRALTLFKLIADHNGPISIGELVEKSNMNRTTAWRLLATLEQHDFIERDSFNKGYQIGYSASRLSVGKEQFSPLIRRAWPSMEKLSKMTNETILLSVPKHFGTLTIYQLDPPRSVRLVDYVDTKLPLHCTSNGKLLLSQLSITELNNLLQEPLEQVSPLTITDPEQLRQEIDKVRKCGFAIVIGELDENENGISVPIIDHMNHLIAFISVYGPAFRFAEERALSLASIMIETAQEISDALK
jgi:IclR family KDG regulon transcriptional repressor